MARDSGNPIRRNGEDLDFLLLLLLLLLLLELLLLVMFVDLGSNSSVSSALLCLLPLLGDSCMLCDTVGDTFCDVSLSNKIFATSSSSMSWSQFHQRFTHAFFCMKFWHQKLQS